MTATPSATLLIGIGNPGRGDDALGPLLVERISQLKLIDTECLIDFQLQIEYVLDLMGRDRVIIVDASVSGPEPYYFGRVDAEADASITSHSLSPAALLDAYARLYGPPPTSQILAIRGYTFELGAPLSMQAASNLESACACLTTWLNARGLQGCS